jgi:hypothetical protein
MVLIPLFKGGNPVFLRGNPFSPLFHRFFARNVYTGGGFVDIHLSNWVMVFEPIVEFGGCSSMSLFSAGLER